MKMAVAFVLGLLSNGAYAQAPEPPLPPTAPKETGPSPATSYLMDEFGISEAEAKERLAVQQEVIQLSERLDRENDPAYADLYIQHTPTFKVMVAFADNKDRTAFVQSLSPRLRRYVQLIAVPKSRRQNQADLEAIAAALSASGLNWYGLSRIAGATSSMSEASRTPFEPES